MVSRYCPRGQALGIPMLGNLCVMSSMHSHGQMADPFGEGPS